MSIAPERDAPSAAPPPHGVDLDRHASISADVAEGDRSMKVVVEAHDLTESQWMEPTQFWMGRIGDDLRLRGADATVVHDYSDAFAKAQDALAPVATMDPEGWATLVVASQSERGVAPALAARSLSNADHIRLARHFARRLAENPDEAARFQARYQALHAEPNVAHGQVSPTLPDD